MNRPTIIITGANGFVGQQLVSYFSTKGWRVKALVRVVPEKTVKEVVYIKYDLEQNPDEAIFDDSDYLVHCAYLKFDQNKNAEAINISGTKKIVELCRKKNIKPLFLSSFSAHKDAESHYGKTKLECEKLFDVSNEVVLKPGLVIGKKGLAAELIKTIGKASFLPLVGGGTQPIQTIHVDDLCLIVEQIFEKKIVGVFHVAEAEAITMKQFYQEIAKQLNRKSTFIPFPLSLLYFICKLSEAIGVKLPVSSESALGLKHLIKFETKNDLNRLGITIKNYSESLSLVIR